MIKVRGIPHLKIEMWGTRRFHCGEKSQAVRIRQSNGLLDAATRVVLNSAMPRWATTLNFVIPTGAA